MSLHLKLTCDRHICWVTVTDTGQALAATSLQKLLDMRMIIGNPPETSNRCIGDP